MTEWLGQLRSRTLFFMLAGLFALDTLLLDPLPFVDELVLAVLTLLAARWKKPSVQRDKPPTKNVTPD